MRSALVALLLLANSSIAQVQPCYLTADTKNADGTLHRQFAQVLVKNPDHEFLIQVTRNDASFKTEVVFKQAVRGKNPINITVDGNRHPLQFHLENGRVIKLSPSTNEPARSRNVGRDETMFRNSYSITVAGADSLATFKVLSITLGCYGVALKSGNNQDNIGLTLSKEIGDVLQHQFRCIQKSEGQIEKAVSKSNPTQEQSKTSKGASTVESEIQEEYLDVISMLDGRIIKGIIVEQVPGRAVRIRVSNSEDLVVDFDDILSIYKEVGRKSDANEAVRTVSHVKENHPQTQKAPQEVKSDVRPATPVTNSNSSLPKERPHIENERVTVVPSLPAQEKAVAYESSATQRVNVSTNVNPRPQQNNVSQTGGEEVLTNKDIVQLTKIGLDPAVIINKIAVSPGAYDISTNALIELKNNNVASNVITEMMNKGATKSEKQVSNTIQRNTNSTQESGIYLLSGEGQNSLIKIRPTRVANTSNSGGGFYGFGGSSAKAHISGPKAQVQVTDDFPEFQFYFNTDDVANRNWFTDASSPTDFALVKFIVTEKERLFKIGGSSSGPMSGSSRSGIPEDLKIHFRMEEIEPGVFKVVLEKPLEGGEYGFIFQNGLFEKVFDFSKPVDERNAKKRRD
jgi:hypothetical protein